MSPERYKCIFILVFLNVIIVSNIEANDQITAETNNLADNKARTLFSPRLEYNEWMPVGRGDPLKNDPTYDYSPPVLERVRYWPDANLNKEKSTDILLLGVPSKKSSGKKDSIYGPVRRNFFTPNNNMQIPTVLMPPPLHNHLQQETGDIYHFPQNNWSQIQQEKEGMIGFSNMYRITSNKMPTGNGMASVQNVNPYMHQQYSGMQHVAPPQMATAQQLPPIIRQTTPHTEYRKPLLHTILQNESVHPFTKTAMSSTITEYTASYYNPQNINAMAQNVYQPPPTTEYVTPTSYVTPTTTTDPPSMTTDSLFSHYKQPAQPIKGPLYLIIEGHSKVKTYGLNNNNTVNHQPIIVPVGSTEDPVVRHVVSREDNGKNALVKHLHTKPATQRTVIVDDDSGEKSSAMNNLLSLLDSSFGNYLLDEESQTDNGNAIDSNEDDKDAKARKARSIDNQKETYVIASFQVGDNLQITNTPYYPYRRGFVENAITPRSSKAINER